MLAANHPIWRAIALASLALLAFGVLLWSSPPILAQTVIATVAVGSTPRDVAVNPTTNRVFVANDATDTVTVVQDLVPTPSPTALPPTGGPPVGVVLVVGVALLALGMIGRRLSTAHRRLIVLLCLLLATLGSSLAMASEPQAVDRTIAPAPGPAGRVALAFDDGYNSRSVNRVLDTLQRDGVRATFFPVGIWVQRDPTTFRRIVARHEVGNHTFSHPFLTRLSDAAVRREILGGVIAPPFLFRPPYGDINSRVRAIVRPLGLAVVLWNVDSRDYTGISPSLVTRNVVRGAANGRIILMHMGDWNTAAALPQIIAELRARGFTFATVSDFGIAGRGP